MTDEPRINQHRGNTAKVLNAIKLDTEPRACKVIAKAAGLTSGVTSRILTRLLRQKRITAYPGTGARSTYGMTDAQRHMVGNLVVILNERRVGLELDPVNAVERMRFLEGLRARPAFAGVAILEAIIQDYRSAFLRLSMAEDDGRRKRA